MATAHMDDSALSLHTSSASAADDVPVTSLDELGALSPEEEQFLRRLMATVTARLAGSVSSGVGESATEDVTHAQRVGAHDAELCERARPHAVVASEYPSVISGKSQFESLFRPTEDSPSSTETVPDIPAVKGVRPLWAAECYAECYTERDYSLDAADLVAFKYVSAGAPAAAAKRPPWSHTNEVSSAGDSLAPWSHNIEAPSAGDSFATLAYFAKYNLATNHAR